MNILTDNPVAKWEFLDEPLWRWAVFIIAFSFLTGAWAFVLREMKD
jgi:hypothetical protein